MSGNSSLGEFRSPSVSVAIEDSRDGVEDIPSSPDIGFRNINTLSEETTRRVAPETSIVATPSAFYVLDWAEAPCPCLYCLVLALRRNDTTDQNRFQGETSIVRQDRFAPNTPGAWGIALAIGKHGTMADRPWSRSGEFWRVDKRTLLVTREILLTSETCSRCNAHNPPRVQLDQQMFSEPPKRKPHSPTRHRSTEDVRDAVRDACLGRFGGIVQEYGIDLQMPMAAASAWSPVTEKRREPTLGRAGKFNDAITVAFIEALERNAGLFGGKNHSFTRQSYEDLGEHAVNPETLALHPDPLYDLPGFPFRRFDPKSELTWVSAFDITNQRPIWVPRCFAYYLPTEEPALAFETSNGCATGSTLAEAALHGLLELAERDAFLWYWYSKESPDTLSTLIADHPSLAVQAARLRLFTGADIHVVNTSRDLGIPTVSVLAVRDGDNGPATAIAAGAGLDLASATSSAMMELGGHFMRLMSVFADGDEVDKLRSLIGNHDAIRTMEQHGNFNALPENRACFANWLGTNGSRNASPDLRNSGASPEEIFMTLTGNLQKSGYQIIVINQTTRALERVGLHAVKVIVPGMLPMTFGHRFRRTSLPCLAGYDDAELTPHAFP